MNNHELSVVDIRALPQADPLRVAHASDLMTLQARPTLADVGRLAGVSAKTVSRVFNQPEMVNPETIARVRAAATRLRFRPNTLARGLRRGGGTNTVGFMVGELSNPFYYRVASGLERELAAHGFGLLVATTDDTIEGEKRLADALLSHRIGALVMIPVSPDQSYLDGERHLGTPIITVDRPARNLVADSVVLENREGTLDATRRLLARGHRRIGYACNPAAVFSQSERVAGYRQAMAEAGIHDTKRWERLSDDRSLAPEVLLADLLDGSEAPTALVCGNNRMTVGALRALRERADERTALVGFDDFDTADVIGVTVITYDPFELGRVAARVTLARMADPTGAPRRKSLPTWILERGTGERAPRSAPDK